MSGAYVRVHLELRHGPSGEPLNSILNAIWQLETKIPRLCELPWSSRLLEPTGFHEASIEFTCHGLESTQSSKIICQNLSELCRRILGSEHDTLRDMRSDAGGLYRPVSHHDEYQRLARLNPWRDDVDRLWEIQRLFCRCFLETLVDSIGEPRMVTLDTNPTGGKWLFVENMNIALSAADCATIATDYVHLVPPWHVGLTEGNLADFVINNPDDEVAVRALELAFRIMNGSDGNATLREETSIFELHHAPENPAAGFPGVLGHFQLAMEWLTAFPGEGSDGVLFQAVDCIQYIPWLYDLSLQQRNDMRSSSLFWGRLATVGLVVAVSSSFFAPFVTTLSGTITLYCGRKALSLYLSSDEFLNHVRMANESLQKIWAFATLLKMLSEGKLKNDMLRLTYCARRMEEKFGINVLQNWVDPGYIAQFLGQEMRIFNTILTAAGIE